MTTLVLQNVLRPINHIFDLCPPTRFSGRAYAKDCYGGVIQKESSVALSLVWPIAFSMSTGPGVESDFFFNK